MTPFLIYLKTTNTNTAPAVVSPGSTTSDELALCDTKYYHPSCGQATNLTIELTTIYGTTALYVSTNTTNPSSSSSSYSATTNGSVSISTGSDVYIAVQGVDRNNSFKLTVWSGEFSVCLFFSPSLNTIVAIQQQMILIL